MKLYPLHYAESRPWSKRVANLFQREGRHAVDMCINDVSRSVRSSPLRLADMEQRLLLEQTLAKAYGLFVRGGRHVCRLEEALADQLQATALPARQPDLSALPFECFYIALSTECGAYTMLGEQGAAVELLLTRLPGQGGEWWSHAEEVLSLSLSMHDELLLPDVPALQQWGGVLQQLLKVLALMTQKKLQVVAEVSPVAHQQQHRLGWPDLPQLQTGFAAGYWRRQGDAALGRVVWVPPKNRG